MRFIKRILFVAFLLLIAFWIYRLINPSWAKALLYDLKSFANDKAGTYFSLTGNVVEETSVVLETGTVIDSSLGLQELTGTDGGLLLDAVDSTQESFGTTSSAPVVAPEPTPAITPTTTTSSPKGLSTKEIKDFLNLFQNFQ